MYPRGPFAPATLFRTLLAPKKKKSEKGRTQEGAIFFNNVPHPTYTY
jgi:hypothetical protein